MRFKQFIFEQDLGSPGGGPDAGAMPPPPGGGPDLGGGLTGGPPIGVGGPPMGGPPMGGPPMGGPGDLGGGMGGPDMGGPPGAGGDVSGNTQAKPVNLKDADVWQVLNHIMKEKNSSKSKDVVQDEKSGEKPSMNSNLMV